MTDSPAIQRYASELAALREQGLFKSERIIRSPQAAEIVLADGREVLNFCANNYLGLADHPEVIAAAKDALDSHGFGMASVPKKAAIFASSCLCRSWVPQMKRTEAMPKPWLSSASLAAAITSGWSARPR